MGKKTPTPTLPRSTGGGRNAWSMWMKRIVVAVLMLLIAGVSAGGAVPPPHPATLPVAGPAGEVDFLAMGDWGRGNADQKKVAQTMAAYAQHDGHIQAVLLAGDNFYVPLAGTDDPA